MKDAEVALMVYAEVLHQAFCDMVARYAPDSPRFREMQRNG
jgi:hypothetical protein